MELAAERDGARTRGRRDRFPRVDAASQQARLAYWTRALATLDSIPFDQLSPDEQINAQVFRTTVRALANDVRYKTYEAPFNSDTFFWTEFTPRQGFATPTTYRNYLARLRDVPRYFDEQIVNMRAGLARGYTVPRVSVSAATRRSSPMSKATRPIRSTLPFARDAGVDPGGGAGALRAEAMTVIRDARRSGVHEAARLHARRISAEGAHDARREDAARRERVLPGDDREVHDARPHRAADPRHRSEEVARIKAEMEATKEKAEFHGTMAEFFMFMRTDPQFYAKTPRELFSYSAYVSKKADGSWRETIGMLPRRRHGIRPVPDALAPIYTGGRGGLETCLMNTYNLPARPLYTLASLTLHECTPGHSFQAALALEGPQRPPFRRGTSFLRLRGGVGPLHRMAGHGHGDLRNTL